jgi:hypothetical protein
MLRFKFWNNIIAWGTFAIALVVYMLTLEPTASLWDCGEFIASSYKLQVGHPPGAPFFLLLTKVFSLSASNPSKVALMINAFSGIVSAFTILFLFWTITHLARKLVNKNADDFSFTKIIVILGAGFIGALAYTFSDTFWFSAVEGEVYATSSLFTASVFWAILKWEDSFDEKYANRWLILIGYLMGLSIGVHLLNLLAIPAIVLVFYFKKYKASIKGTLVALTVSFLILLAVQYGVIPGVVYVASLSELFFVNIFGLPFNSGVLIYSILISGFLIWGILYSHKRGKVICNTTLLLLAAIILGYSSYALIVIRSNAGTPLNENAPKDVFSLLYYLNRDQYGDRPLFYGQYYNAPITSYSEGKRTYIRDGSEYIVSYRRPRYNYDSRFTTFFPRIYSSNREHIKVYKDWANIKGTPVTVTRNGKQEIEYKPTFADNIAFFVKYQLGYMYFRYFMWNFAGKQNNLEGNGGLIYGNWLSGIKFLDNTIFGPQDKLPDFLKENKGRNRYYLLPLLFGIVGMFYQAFRNRKDFAVVFMLFVMTGISIVIYLNQTPQQPRERDYAYAGSFYAFSIWIGLGIIALWQLFNKILKTAISAIVAVVLSFVTVPLIMAAENWDDHDRSGRYLSRDIAYNYLHSCAPNSILFTVGDNDTFPLWYLQEVEGIRTDIRVVNMNLLSADWYIEQMKRKVYNSDPLPISFDFEKIRKGKRDYIYFVEKTKEYQNLKDAISFVKSDDTEKKLITESGDIIDYLPSRNIMLAVDTLEVIKNGTIKNTKTGELQPFLPIKFKGGYISKSELIVMDILANNNWKRQVYYVTPYQEGTLGLDSYLRLEGFAYRLVPVKSDNTGMFRTGGIETDIMYDNLMNIFRWEGTNNPDILIDDHYKRVFATLRVRTNFARLAEQLYSEGKRDSAYRVINRCFELFPASTVPHDAYSYILVEACYKIGATERARQVIKEFSKNCAEESQFYAAMPIRLRRYTIYESALAESRLDKLKSIAQEYNDEEMVGELMERMQ